MHEPESDGKTSLLIVNSNDLDEILMAFNEYVSAFTKRLYESKVLYFICDKNLNVES